MKVIDGKIIRVIQTCSFEVVKNYLKDNPEYELLDTETWEDNPFARENWYYLIHKDYYANEGVTIQLTHQSVLIFDPGYARVRVRVPGEDVARSYLEWAMEACNLFYEGQAPVVFLPKVAGEIQVINPFWQQERSDIIRALRVLCKDYGDNEWIEADHLGDVIEKHLAKYLWKKNG